MTQLVVSDASESAEELIYQARLKCDEHLKHSSINDVQNSTERNKPRHLQEPGWISYVETDHNRDDGDYPRNKNAPAFVIGNSVAMFWKRSIKPFTKETANQFFEEHIKPQMRTDWPEEVRKQQEQRHPDNDALTQDEAEDILDILDLPFSERLLTDSKRDELTAFAANRDNVNLLNTVLRCGISSILNEAHMEDGKCVFAVIKV